MNIYFIYPNDFEPTNFHHLLKMLKVTAIYSLIPKNDRINPDDETKLYLKTANLDNFTYNKAIQKAIESFRITEERKEELREMRR